MRDAVFLRLKAGAADLVDLCGGQKRAGEIIGVSQQQISKIVNRETRDMLSLRAMLMLEAECGVPVLTRVCAELQSHQLERGEAPAGAAPSNPYVAIADISTEYSEAVQEFALRTADGVFSNADGAALDRRLSDIVEKAEAFRRLIALRAAGGGA